MNQSKSNGYYHPIPYQPRLNRRSAARNKFRSLPKARRLALGSALTAAPQLVELLLRVLDF